MGVCLEWFLFGVDPNMRICSALYFEVPTLSTADSCTMSVEGISAICFRRRPFFEYFGCRAGAFFFEIERVEGWLIVKSR